MQIWQRWATVPQIIREQERGFWYASGTLREFCDDPNYFGRGDTFIAQRFDSKAEAEAFVEKYTTHPTVDNPTEPS